MKGAIQRLTSFLIAPERAADADPELQSIRCRLRDTLGELQDRGFDRMSRKHMHCNSHGWAHRKAASGP